MALAGSGRQRHARAAGKQSPPACSTSTVSSPTAACSTPGPGARCSTSSSFASASAPGGTSSRSTARPTTASTSTGARGSRASMRSSAAAASACREGDPDDPPEADTAYGLAAQKAAMLTRGLRKRGSTALSGARRYLQAAGHAGLGRAVISASVHASRMLELAGLATLVEASVDADVIHAGGAPLPAGARPAAVRLPGTRRLAAPGRHVHAECRGSRRWPCGRPRGDRNRRRRRGGASTRVRGGAGLPVAARPARPQAHRELLTPTILAAWPTTSRARSRSSPAVGAGSARRSRESSPRQARVWPSPREPARR